MSGRRRVAVRARLRALLAAAARTATAAAQDAAPPPDGLDRRGGRPALAAFGGDFAASPVLRLDADAGSFSGRFPPGDFRDETDLRRARVGLQGGIGGASNTAPSGISAATTPPA